MNTNLEVTDMATDNRYDIDIGSLTRENGGNVNATLHATVRGKNWLGGPPKIMDVTDDGGLVFVTKPDFNLAASNIGGFRHFDALLSPHAFSTGALLRDTLDPRSVHKSGVPNSALNDPLYPFIAMFDNTLISCDGWPDFVAKEFVSNPGKRGSTYGGYSGTIDDAAKFSLNFTNRNLPGDLVNHLLSFWVRLGTQINKNIFPHQIHVWKDQLCYVSRVYRFVFDSTGQRLSQFTMCGYSYPLTSSIGAVMDYDATQGRNQGYEEISSSWSAYGCFHNDPIVIDEFNRTVMNFNPLMRDNMRERYMTLVGGGAIGSRLQGGRFTGYGYPRINPRTLMFEIWVPTNQYAILTSDRDREDLKAAVRLKLIEDYNQGVLQLTPEERNKLFA